MKVKVIQSETPEDFSNKIESFFKKIKTEADLQASVVAPCITQLQIVKTDQGVLYVQVIMYDFARVHMQGPSRLV